LKVNAGRDDVAVLLHPKYHTKGTDEYAAKNRFDGQLYQTTKANTHIYVHYYFAECVKKRHVFAEGVTEPQDFDEDVNEPGVFDEEVIEPGVFDEGITEPRGIYPAGIPVVRLLRAVKITIT